MCIFCLPSGWCYSSKVGPSSLQLCSRVQRGSPLQWSHLYSQQKALQDPAVQSTKCQHGWLLSYGPWLAGWEEKEAGERIVKYFHEPQVWQRKAMWAVQALVRSATGPQTLVMSVGVVCYKRKYVFETQLLFVNLILKWFGIWERLTHICGAVLLCFTELLCFTLFYTGSLLDVQPSQFWFKTLRASSFQNRLHLKT